MNQTQIERLEAKIRELQAELDAIKAEAAPKFKKGDKVIVRGTFDEDDGRGEGNIPVRIRISNGIGFWCEYAHIEHDHG